MKASDKECHKLISFHDMNMNKFKSKCRPKRFQQ